jgi:Protein of unknown function (DUF3313)
MLMERIETKCLTYWLVPFLVLALSACSSDRLYKTGFLTDYSKLSRSPYKEAEKGTLLYENKKNSLGNYNKIILTRVQIRLSKTGKDRGVDRKKLKELYRYAGKQLRAELNKSGYQIVLAPGPGVLRFRGALTDVEPGIPLANIHPATVISGIGLGGASMEWELQDSETGEVIVAVIDTRKGARGFDGFTKYGNAKDVIEKWAKIMVLRLDQAHGKTRE